MELSDMTIFLAVADEGSISRAAGKLDYVQSNITLRIRKLEAELGVALFHRHPKGVKLTAKGLAFYEQAADIVRKVEEAVKSVRETEHPSGVLSIGVVETIAAGNFMNVLSRFRTQYPDVELSLTTGLSQPLIRSVLNNELDGAFVAGAGPSAQLIAEYTGQEEIVLVTHAANGAFPDLSKMTWVVFPKGCPYRAVTEAWLQHEGFPFDKTIEISALDTLMGCVRAGLGSTLLPKSIVAHSNPHLQWHPFPEAYRTMNVSLVRRKDRFVSKAFAALAEQVRDSGL